MKKAAASRPTGGTLTPKTRGVPSKATKQDTGDAPKEVPRLQQDVMDAEAKAINKAEFTEAGKQRLWKRHTPAVPSKEEDEDKVEDVDESEGVTKADTTTPSTNVKMDNKSVAARRRSSTRQSAASVSTLVALEAEKAAEASVAVSARRRSPTRNSVSSVPGAFKQSGPGDTQSKANASAKEAIVMNDRPAKQVASDRVSAARRRSSARQRLSSTLNDEREERENALSGRHAVPQSRFAASAPGAVPECPGSKGTTDTLKKDDIESQFAELRSRASIQSSLGEEQGVSTPSAISDAVQEPPSPTIDNPIMGVARLPSREGSLQSSEHSVASVGGTNSNGSTRARRPKSEVGLLPGQPEAESSGETP